MTKKEILESMVTCSECHDRMVKSGTKVINRKGDRKQQWKCINCYRRTVNPVVDNKVT